MRRLRAALRWLDPWGASLLGVLVALGVVILLATPGPWHPGATPAVRLAEPPPEDIAVFVQGGRGARCTGVVWLHADYEGESLTASVLAPPTQGLVNGGGYAAIDRIVTDVGPRRAAAALGRSLGLTFDAWAVVDKEALRLAVPGMFPAGDQMAQRREFRLATAAWAGVGGAAVAWPRQYGFLANALPGTAFSELNIVSFANYVLGFGFVRSDLDLRGASSLAQLVKGLEPDQVRVRAVPAVLERCREGRAWRVDAAAVEQLRGSLAFGVEPRRTQATVDTRRLSATVVVTGPPAGAPGRAYLEELRRRLRRSAGAPVRLEVLRPAPGLTLGEAIGRRLDEGRPLAVVIADALAPLTGPETEAAVTSVADAAAVLRERVQPALICGPALPPAGDDDELTAALQKSGLPVTQSLPADEAGVVQPVWDAGRARRAAGDNSATLVRVCWPGALAPRLVSTRTGFAFAAAQRVAVVVVGEEAALAERLAAKLRTYGFDATAMTGSDWSAPLQIDAVYYRPGAGRAARALAGDLGISPAAVVADPGAPEQVTVASHK